jgi:hypothetical protein
MRRLLFAIALVALAVAALSACAAPDRPGPTPTPAPVARNQPSRIPAPTTAPTPPAATATPQGAPQPTNGGAADLRAAYEQTRALTSFKADMVVQNNIAPGAQSSDLQFSMASHTVLTITADGLQQYVEMDSPNSQTPTTREAMDMILIGSTGYISGTRLADRYRSAPITDTTEPETGWMIMPGEQSAMMSASNAILWSSLLGQLLDAEHDLPLLALEGQEDVSGVACDRYFTDKASLGPSGILPGLEIAQKDLTIWRCADGNLRRIETRLSFSPKQNQESAVTLTMKMLLIEAPTTAVITAPANAVPMKR